MARANHLASDRQDIAFAVNILYRGMANPTVESWQRLKRLACYLVLVPSQITRFRHDEQIEGVRLYVDADWAG